MRSNRKQFERLVSVPIVRGADDEINCRGAKLLCEIGHIDAVMNKRSTFSHLSHDIAIVLCRQERSDDWHFALTNFWCPRASHIAAGPRGQTIQRRGCRARDMIALLKHSWRTRTFELVNSAPVVSPSVLRCRTRRLVSHAVRKWRARRLEQNAAWDNHLQALTTDVVLVGVRREHLMDGELT